MHPLPRIHLSFLMLISLSISRAPGAELYIFASHTAPGVGSPAELLPGHPAHHRNPVFLPGEPIHIWAQAQPGIMFISFGIDLEARDGALLDGPITVPNPTLVASPGYTICRWNDFRPGAPPVPPPATSIINIKMVCLPIPGYLCSEWVAISNPVNSLNLPDGHNDPATGSVHVLSLKAAGLGGSCYMIVNSLLIVDYPSSGSSEVYFGWGDAPVSGLLAGARSDLPDWFVEPDSDDDGILDRFDNCEHMANTLQRDADGDGRGDRCDLCPGRRTGDVSGDQAIDLDDVPGFVTQLLAGAAALDDDACAADADYSGLVDGADVSAFLAILLNGEPDRSPAPRAGELLAAAAHTAGLQPSNAAVLPAPQRALSMNPALDWNHDGAVDARDIAAWVASRSLSSPSPPGADADARTSEIDVLVNALLGE